MKQLSVILLALLTTLVACGSKQNKVVQTRDDGSLQAERSYNTDTGRPVGQWKFYYPNGKLFASAHFDASHPTGTGWQFFNEDGSNYFAMHYDSITVTELGENDTPATVCCHCADTQVWRQFYSTYTLRGQGITVGGVREGEWLFYYPDGQLQTEATFVGGHEEGRYNVYRQNGAPYYLGHYTHGNRSGTWEVYDQEGNLVTTQQY